MHYIIFGLVAVLLLWTIGSYLVIRNLEEPTYTVLEKRDGYEIRTYEPYITAQTEVVGNYSESLNKGFGLVANYIFGNNTAKENIVMTVPVLESKSSSEKIAMTVPVLNTSTDEEKRTISFILPSKYTLDSLPSPKNPRVVLVEVPARTVAVLRFSWYATERSVTKKTTLLTTYLERDGIEIHGPTQVAQYNPPLSMPITHRNEIIIPILIAK
jgi:hypothetical protein